MLLHLQINENSANTIQIYKLFLYKSYSASIDTMDVNLDVIRIAYIVLCSKKSAVKSEAWVAR